MIMLAALAFFHSLGTTCLHYQDSYRGVLSDVRQDVFLYQQDEDAHMVVRTQLKANKFPREIAWVLPLPSMPSKYEEIDGPLFMELEGFFTEIKSNRFGSKGEGVKKESVAGTSAKIKVYKKVDVGSYQIQPIEILHDDSAIELNAWLKKNKFNTMPDKLQKPYLKKGATFLAIRMPMNHPASGELISKPLHIVYKTKQLTFPIRFTHENRLIDLNVFVFNQNEPKENLEKFYLKKVGSVAYKDKDLVPFVDDLIGKQTGFLTLYYATDLNTVTKKLSKLTEDPVF